MNVLWNDGWQFVKLPLGSTFEQALSAPKRAVTLPHDWLIEDTDRLYESGDGWYFKQLFFDREKNGDRRVILSFDGVYMDCDVMVGGETVCTHRYGYTAFRTDVTEHLMDGDNRISVHIRHQSPNSRWYSGAGIYRDVRLLSLPASHMIPDGFQVNTLEGEKGWTLSVQAELSAPAAGKGPSVTLTDAAGNVLLQGAMTADGQSASYTAELRDVCPWSPDEPSLYTLTLRYGEQTEKMNVGFRSLRFDPDRGFFLNGKHEKIKGVCLHHDLGALGAAFYEKAADRQLRVMKEMGVNAVRTAHNPPARQLLELCDRMGLMVMDELYDMWELPKTPYDNARFFPDTYRQSVAEWVRRDRCHPCVILWSIGNEIYDMQASDRGQMWTRLLMEETRKHDSVHAPVTFGSNYMPWKGAQKCADIVKLPGYNYAEKYYAEHHRLHPDWVIFGSETASILASRGVYHFPMDQDILSDEDLQCSALLNSNTSWGAQDLRKMLVEDRLNPFTLGQFIWAGIDYIGEPTPYHTRSCYFGQTDTACFPKDAYYFYQAMWTDKPMVHIGVTWDWNEGQLIDVPVMTNGDFAALSLNGRSLGVKPVNRDDVRASLPVWKIAYEPGVLEAQALSRDGRVLCTHIRRTPGEPASIRLRADRDTLQAGCCDLAFITADALDENGVPVENASDRIRFTVTGAGRLMGLDNGDSTDRDSYQSDSRRLFSGKLLCIVGADGESGIIHVKAEGNRLKSAEITLQVTPFAREERRTLPGISLSSCEDQMHWIRRIDIRPLNGTALTPKQPEAAFGLSPLPAWADRQEIRVRITNAQGVDVPCMSVRQEGNMVWLRGLGDGSVYMRAAACNGYPFPRVTSVLEVTAQGFGPMGLDPYGFIAGALHDKQEGEIAAGNEQGLSFAREGYSAAGFSNVDFGPVGADTITLPIFALDGSRYEIGLWDGMPGENGRLIMKLPYEKPSIWNVYQPETYRLPEILRGVHTIAFSLDRKIHLKGFSFARPSRIGRYIQAGDADTVYGDSFTRDGGAVRRIGNNVTLSFDHVTFENAGRKTLVLDGRTPLPENPVHVKITGPDGETQTTMCLFKGTERGGQSFPVNAPQGECQITFVFLPGSQFDFFGFTLTEREGHGDG